MKKQCKRRVWALVDPIKHAIDGARICTSDILQDLRTRELSAIEAFAKGSATLQDWADITALMNVCENMSMNGIGPEALPTCDEAHTHLIDAAKRYEKTKRMGTTGPGLQCFRELYEWHDLQRTSIARAEYDKHIAMTANRIRSKSPEVTDILECA